MAKFRPVPKPKKYTPRHLASVDPLPVDHRPVDPLIVGIFTGLAVEVCDPAAIALLSRDGCFGQGTRSRSFPAAVRRGGESVPVEEEDGLSKENLSLCLEEVLFLVRELGILRVQSLDGRALSEADLIARFSTLKQDFVSAYVAFLYFKARNWVVKSGLKFGGDFLLYQKGPQFYHASYIVLLQSYQNNRPLSTSAGRDLDRYDFQSFNRISETTAKDLLLLEVHFPPDVDSRDSGACFERLATFKVSEMFPRHYNFDGARTGQQ